MYGSTTKTLRTQKEIKFLFVSFVSLWLRAFLCLNVEVAINLKRSDFFVEF
jgi:hypothetical protein